MQRIKAPSNESWLSASAPGCSSDRCSKRPPRTRPRSPRSSRGRAGAARLRPPPRGRSCGEPRPGAAAKVGGSGASQGVGGAPGGSPAQPRGEGAGGGPWPEGPSRVGHPAEGGEGPRGCSAAAFFRRIPRTPSPSPPSGATLPVQPSVPSPPPSLAVSPGSAGGRAEGRRRQSAVPLEVRGQPQLPPPPSLPPRPDTLVALFLPSEAGLSLPPRFPSCGPIPPAAAVTSPPDAACGGRRPEVGAALPPLMANAFRTCCLIDLTAIHFTFFFFSPFKPYCSTVS